MKKVLIATILASLAHVAAAHCVTGDDGCIEWPTLAQMQAATDAQAVDYGDVISRACNGHGQSVMCRDDIVTFSVGNLIHLTCWADTVVDSNNVVISVTITCAAS